MTTQKIVRDAIRAIPDFPRPGILFRDITPVMEDPAAFAAAVAGLEELLEGTAWNAMGAIESRGFVFGAPVALRAGRPLVLLRKQGKLPGRTLAASYALEYGEAVLEMHVDSLDRGDRVVLIDDLLATGGTAAAAATLVKKAGAEVAAFLFLVELDDLKGRDKLAQVAPVFSLVNY